MVQRKKPSQTELKGIETNPSETEVYDELREKHGFAEGDVKVKGMGVPNADVTAQDDKRFAAVEVKGEEKNWTSERNLHKDAGAHVPAKQIAGAVSDNKDKVLRLLRQSLSTRLSTNSLMLAVKGLDTKDALMAVITKRGKQRMDAPRIVAQHPVTVQQIREFLKAGAGPMGVKENDTTAYVEAFIKKVDLLLGLNKTAEDDPRGEYERVLPRTERGTVRSILPTGDYESKMGTTRDLFASQDIREQQQPGEYPFSAEDPEQYENAQDQVDKLVVHFTRIFNNELPDLVKMNQAGVDELRSMDVLESAYNVERLTRDHDILRSGKDPDAVKSLNWMRSSNKKEYGVGEYYIHLQPVTSGLPDPVAKED